MKKLYRKFWNICSCWLPAVTIGAILLILLSLVDIQTDGIHAGSVVLPIRTGGSTVDWVWATALSITLPVLYFLSILIFLWERKSTWWRMAGFQLQLVLVVLVPVLISVGSFQAMMRFLLLTAGSAVILNGFLLLFGWLLGSRLISASIMILLQLCAPALANLHAFHDLLPGWWGKLAVFLYRELPIYLKISAMWDELDWAALLPDLILAALVMGYAWIVHKMEDRTRLEASD